MMHPLSFPPLVSQEGVQPPHPVPTAAAGEVFTLPSTARVVIHVALLSGCLPSHYYRLIKVKVIMICQPAALNAAMGVQQLRRRAPGGSYGGTGGGARSGEVTR